VRSHTLLKKKGLTQMDAASASGIDRKTLAKIDRGEEVKASTLARLANKLGVPPTYFDPPAAETSLPQSDGKAEDSRWLNLMLRKIDVESLAKMLSSNQRINWALNVHSIDDDTVQLLEQLEDAVNDLREHMDYPWDVEDTTLRAQLAGLKKTKRVANLLEELAKLGLGILGAEYLAWESEQKFEYHGQTEFKTISYVSTRCIALSVEAHPGHPRRARVWQGNEPPKSSPERHTIIAVNGVADFNDDDIPF
jgi:DNA-binding Xre family transcriptional regulator